MKTDGLVPAPGNSDDKAPDSSENGIKKTKPVKAKKRKLKGLRDAGAPKQPLTGIITFYILTNFCIYYKSIIIGYIRFMNDRREALKAENTSLGFVELTRLLAEEWGSLDPVKKKPYLDAAEQDRERFLLFIF